FVTKRNRNPHVTQSAAPGNGAGRFPRRSRPAIPFAALTTQMKPTPRLYCLAALALGVVGALPAQTPAAAATKSDDVVKLSEFQVSEKSSNSYIASETMTGSRVNT